MHHGLAEAYIKNILELEGRNLTEKSKESIVKFLREIDNQSSIAVTANNVIARGLFYKDVPEIWEAIGKAARQQKMVIFTTMKHNFFVELACSLAEAGYQNEDTWKHIKD